MGDLNLDMTRNQNFVAVTYALATVGAAVSVLAVGPLTVPAFLGAVAAGGLVGGIGLPVAAIGIVGLLDVPKHGFKLLFGGMGIIGFNCAKALFVTPFQTIFKGVKKLFSFGKKEQTSPVNPPVADDKAASFKDASVQKGFNAEAKPAADAAPAAPKADTPKPPQP